MTEYGSVVVQIADGLLGVEMELRQLELWDSERPLRKRFKALSRFVWIR